MKKFLSSLLAATLMVAGCAEQVTQQDAASGDYGAPIDQATCERIARDSVTPLMRDPSSPIFSFGPCTKQAQHSIPIANLPKQFGYGMQFTVNGKNGFGGYAGARPFYVLIKDGQIIRRLRANDDGTGMFPI